MIAFSNLLAFVSYTVLPKVSSSHKTRIKEHSCVFGVRADFVWLIHRVFSAKSAWKCSKGVLKKFSLNKIQLVLHTLSTDEINE